MIFFLVFSAHCEREPLFRSIKVKDFFEKKQFEPNEDDLTFVVQPVEIPKEEEIVKAIKQGETVETDLTTKDNILKAYGDPAENVEVKAQDSAPLPYKGMLAALNIGNKELAFDYAKQYVRYKKDVMETVSEAVKAQGYAKFAEGEELNPEKLIKEDPNSEYLKYALKDLDEKKSKEAKDLDEEAAQVLNSAQETTVNEKSDRMLAKKNLIEFLKDLKPAKKVDLIYFLKPGQVESATMAKEIEKVKAKYQGKINVVGMTLDTTDKLALKDFKEENALSFEIGVGKKLATDLKITGTPTLLFITDVKQSYVEEGIHSEFYIDEIIKSFGVNS